MTYPNTPQMPDDPGAPENTDPEYVSPDQAETLADEAAESAALDEADEDPLGESAELSDAEIDDALGAEREVNTDADGDGVVSEAELQLAERTEDLQRLSAEYANYRRRSERERAQVAEVAKSRVITELLPLLDDLELAAQHGDLNEGPLKAFSDKFRSVLEAQGLSAFGTAGDEFDPELHEAVQDLSQGETKVVDTVLRKGYRVGDRLVRNAMVLIGDPAEGKPEA
ncbi:nucleotide exchange factor GrpE [Corynebacterium liangguodongii]|uniref:Protein GrpE n=1 Tax=Corynebacterium liangguodongii TaxID=2079535 RepID=A0A2S0WG36_9CORY|nr:nucleotide exchange factor GrpE [Corynebacterium liangguodongii]AWB84729.1 nucleotide exchange factor GrpE [Corynebacterium liangguodongii]PWB99737.1 nucleotide exchange factor GrpE [Corynebacterium liangguodongii]